MNQSKEDQLTILVAGCRKGDRKAQETVYHLFSRKMFAVCLRYCSDRAEAEDVLIIGFTKVFSRIASFKDEGSFEGWMRRIVVNSALSEYRKKTKRLYTLGMDEAGDDMAAVSFQEDTAGVKYLLHLIQALPDHLRAAFNLFAIEGYSHQEISALLGISEDLSKVHVFRARKQLQLKIRQSERVMYA